jgi:hypothetical protein
LRFLCVQCLVPSLRKPFMQFIPGRFCEVASSAYRLPSDFIFVGRIQLFPLLHLRRPDAQHHEVCVVGVFKLTPFRSVQTWSGMWSGAMKSCQ